ncbi:MAG: methyltransferase domain-containing protein [Geobacteraceae bacterium]|nr:methyltransferase domain-containing protein [Geobacteraceae bacterium]
MSQLIVLPNSGFSNRLKSLISASLLDKDYKVYWPPELFCGLNYADIFRDAFREIDHVPAGSKLLNTWRFELPAELRNLLPVGFSDCSTGYKGIKFPCDNQSRTIDFEYLKIPQPILAVLIKQFTQLRFSEEITARVNARLAEMPRHFTGVHARSWFDEPERNHKWFNFDDFVKVCSRFRDQELFVTSDDPAFIQSLSHALNKKLIVLERSGQRAPKPWDQNNRAEMLDDIVELLVLSHASCLVLTAMSTYSEVAWFLGGCREEIYFADPDCQHKGHAGFGRRGVNGDESISTITNNAGTMNMDDSIHGQDFYNSQIIGSLQSAQVYLYHLFSIWGVPGSVADLGCGRGAWLATCRDLGVKRVVGFDGDWNSPGDMLDPNIEFHSANLEKPLPPTGTFDLAISLEVAEHLQPESSDTFVESLSSLSDAVLFGAAFIGQPGANHINTRPHSFWARKFFDRGYVLFDLFRPLFWNDDRVEPCYRQNTFLYVKPGHNLYLTLVDRGYACNRDARFIDCVHPAIYLGLLNEFNRLQALGANPREMPLPDRCSSVVTSAALPDDRHRIERLIEDAEAQVALNQLDDAADTYRLALAQEPNNPECLLRLSHLLLRTKSYEECFHHARHFLRIASDVAFGYYLAGHAAREIGRWREARTYLLRAVELDPSHVFAGVLCCMSSFTVCMNEAEARSIMKTYNAELDELIRNTGLETAEQIDNAVYGIGALSPFFLPYLGYDVKDLQAAYGAWICAVMAAKYPKFTHSPPVRSSNNTVKIGIVSNYFHNHSNWKIPIRGWLEQLDRQLFSIHCFYTGGVDDAATESARSLADHFLQSNDVETLATAIYEQELDVLIYPGIGMDTVTLKLAALRLVPVQCASWGHPVTTGLPSVDYYISSDLMEPPDGDGHYTENLVRLPNVSIWYEPGGTNGTAPGDLVIPGLEPQDVLFLCCQNLLKYLPRHDLIFPAIAGLCVHARFVFIASHVPELTEKFIQRINLVFQGRGLNAADHVIVLPQLGEADFSALNARADIFLDSIEWSGCNTVFESLPFNKPIVTLPGQFMRGRHAYAILKMMGVEETIATSMEEYISIAVRLALDTQWRDDVSGRISCNKHKIYQDRECITAMEHFLMRVSGRGIGGADANE